MMRRTSFGPGPVVVAGVSAVVVLGGCADASAGGGQDGSDGGGPSVPFGASAEEWQEAFADIEDPIELTFEVPNNASVPSGVFAQELADRADELSGGKVQVEIAFQYAVSGALDEVDEALTDGRLDFGMLTPYLDSQEFPLSGTITNDTTMLYPTGQIGGYLAGWGAANEVWWNTPEFHDEMTERGLTVLSPQSAAPRSVMSCREPVTSMDDLSGKQVRVAPITNHRQIEALGATPVSVPYLELYESAQRGIVDCIVSALGTLDSLDGLAELVPYVIAPVDTNFSGTSGYWVAGSSWPDLPLAVQQLFFDLTAEMEQKGVKNSLLDGPLEVRDDGAAAGGEWLTFDDDVNTALAEFNQTLIDDEWRTSPLLDGEDFLNRWDTAIDQWTDRIDEIGITTAELSDVEQWSTTDIDWDAYTDLYYEHLVQPNRPD